MSVPHSAVLILLSIDQRAEALDLDRLKKLRLLSLEKKRLQGDLIAAFQYFKRATGKLAGFFLQGHVALGQGEVALN